ncbi:hypothetical protein ABIF50_007188 [Bradyrhizobium diazoefficiens]
MTTFRWPIAAPWILCRITHGSVLSMVAAAGIRDLMDTTRQLDLWHMCSPAISTASTTQ